MIAQDFCSGRQTQCHRMTCVSGMLQSGNTRAASDLLPSPRESCPLTEVITSPRSWNEAMKQPHRVPRAKAWSSYYCLISLIIAHQTRSAPTRTRPLASAGPASGGRPETCTTFLKPRAGPSSYGKGLFAYAALRQAPTTLSGKSLLTVRPICCS